MPTNTNFDTKDVVFFDKSGKPMDDEESSEANGDGGSPDVGIPGYSDSFNIIRK